MMSAHVCIGILELYLIWGYVTTSNNVKVMSMREVNDKYLMSARSNDD